MNKNLPEIMTVAPGSMTPLFGRTQYLRGAVVFTLKHTLLSEGFFSLRLVVTTSVKGPGGHRMANKCIIISVFWSTLHSTTARKINATENILIAIFL